MIGTSLKLANAVDVPHASRKTPVLLSLTLCLATTGLVSTYLIKEIDAQPEVAEVEVQEQFDRTPKTQRSIEEIVEQSSRSIGIVEGSQQHGSCFLVGDGLLVTNRHVIEGEYARDLRVSFPSAEDFAGQWFPVEVVGVSDDRDLALLRCDVDLPGLSIAPSDEFRKGSMALLIGSPGIGNGERLENAVHTGVFSTTLQFDGQYFHQLSIAINAGNSGGPVLNSDGQVAGVATLKSLVADLVAFGIPASEIAELIEAYYQTDSVTHKRHGGNHDARVAMHRLHFLTLLCSEACHDQLERHIAGRQTPPAADSQHLHEVSLYETELGFDMDKPLEKVLADENLRDCVKGDLAEIFQVYLSFKDLMARRPDREFAATLISLEERYLELFDKCCQDLDYRPELFLE